MKKMNGPLSEPRFNPLLHYNWQSEKFGPMWQTKYALAVPENLGVELNFRPCSEGDFLTGRPQSVFKSKLEKGLRIFSFEHLKGIAELHKKIIFLCQSISLLILVMSSTDLKLKLIFKYYFTFVTQMATVSLPKFSGTSSILLFWSEVGKASPITV